MAPADQLTTLAISGWMAGACTSEVCLSTLTLDGAVQMARWPYPALVVVESYVKFRFGSALIILSLITLLAVELVRK